MPPTHPHEEIQRKFRETVQKKNKARKIYDAYVWPFIDVTFNKTFRIEAIKLITVPVLIGAMATFLTNEFQKERNQNQILEDYFNQMEKLTLEADLISKEPKAGSIILARGRTIATLAELDLKRKNQTGYPENSG